MMGTLFPLDRTGAAAVPSALTPAEIVAVHEAGHAIAYHYYGLRHGGIRLSIDADGDPIGSCTSPSGRYECRARAVICLAGPVAEQRLTDIDLYDQPGSRTDLEMAREALSRIHVPDVDLVLPFTRLLVRRHWPAIIRVAEALLRTGSLSWEQTTRLVGDR